MSSRNDDQKNSPEKENDAGSSFDHMDDIELGRVSPPTKLDFSRLNETKIAKIEMERSGKKDVPESDADDTGDIGDFDHTSPVKKLVDGKWVTIREAYPPSPYVSSDDDTSTKDELPPGCDYHPTDYCMDPERGSPSTILSEEPRKCQDVRKDCKCSLGYEYPYNIGHILRKVKEMLSIEHPTILDAGVAEVYIDDALAMVDNITPNRADGPKSPCCSVAMVWINTKQHYICPNCGNHPPEKTHAGSQSEILELTIDHKDGNFITWSMCDPNNSTRKFGEDDVALIQQVIGGLSPKDLEKEGE